MWCAAAAVLRTNTRRRPRGRPGTGGMWRIRPRTCPLGKTGFSVRFSKRICAYARVCEILIFRLSRARALCGIPNGRRRRRRRLRQNTYNIFVFFFYVFQYSGDIGRVIYVPLGRTASARAPKHFAFYSNNNCRPRQHKARVRERERERRNRKKKKK